MRRLREARRAGRARAPRRARFESVEFVLVGTLLTVLTLAVLQLGLAIYVRNVVHDAAVEGAHYAALADTSLAEGSARTREIVAQDRRRRTMPATSRCARRGRSDTTPSRSPSSRPCRSSDCSGAPRSLEVTAHAPVESLE